jgi:hypothetical protein
MEAPLTLPQSRLRRRDAVPRRRFRAGAHGSRGSLASRFRWLAVTKRFEKRSQGRRECGCVHASRFPPSTHVCSVYIPRSLTRTPAMSFARASPTPQQTTRRTARCGTALRWCRPTRVPRRRPGEMSLMTPLPSPIRNLRRVKSLSPAVRTNSFPRKPHRSGRLCSTTSPRCTTN